MITKVKVKDLKPNPENPRVIKDDKFEKLVASIKEFPEMLDKRPLVVDENMVILGGNMRFRAIQHLGIKEVNVIIADGWSQEQKAEFIIKDNVSSGEWDFDMLANVFDDVAQLDDWGLNIPTFTQAYTPAFEPTFDRTEVTEQNIEERAKQLAEQFIREYKVAEAMCPKCGHEFEIKL